MESLYSDIDKARALETLLSIDETLSQLEEWNKSVKSSEDYCDSPGGMQLLGVKPKFRCIDFGKSVKFAA